MSICVRLSEKLIYVENHQSVSSLISLMLVVLCVVLYVEFCINPMLFAILKSVYIRFCVDVIGIVRTLLPPCTLLQCVKHDFF